MKSNTVALRIRNLQVRDFRAFRGTHEFAFGADPDQHLELITGPNGSGKSTFIEALQLCLYGDGNQNRIQSFVNKQLVDDIGVDERATAEITVELFDTEENRTIRISREASTLKTPKGRTDVVEDPVIEIRDEDSGWNRVSEPKKYLEQLIPEETRSLSFYDPEQILGLNTWEGGESFDELVSQIRELRNRAAHAAGMPDSSEVNVSAEFLEVLNRNLAMVDETMEAAKSEEYLVLKSHGQEQAALSTGRQILMSFALILSAGELDGVEMPLVMDMPFCRVHDEMFETMRRLLQETSDRQTIIVGLPQRVDVVAEELSDDVESYHQLSFDDPASVDVELIK